MWTCSPTFRLEKVLPLSASTAVMNLIPLEIWVGVVPTPDKLFMHIRHMFWVVAQVSQSLTLMLDVIVVQFAPFGLPLQPPPLIWLAFLFWQVGHKRVAI